MKSKSSRRTRSAASPRDGDSPSPDYKNDLLIAAIGASAGGIEAFTEFVSSLPNDTGMAFVLVQHLDPEHKSMLTELISKKTRMLVKEVTNGDRKSTRLNSSHRCISYAGCCLKKKLSTRYPRIGTCRVCCKCCGLISLITIIFV